MNNLPKFSIRGYTLIELLIGITVVGLLFGLGLSAYGVARDRQEIREMSEQVEIILREAQQSAKVGKFDCTGTFQGYSVTLTTSDTFTIQSICTGGSGNTKEVKIEGATISERPPTTTPPTTNLFFSFNGGINLPDGSVYVYTVESLNSALQNTIEIQPPGIIRFRPN